MTSVSHPRVCTALHDTHELANDDRNGTVCTNTDLRLISCITYSDQPSLCCLTPDTSKQCMHMLVWQLLPPSAVHQPEPLSEPAAHLAASSMVAISTKPYPLLRQYWRGLRILPALYISCSSIGALRRG